MNDEPSTPKTRSASLPRENWAENMGSGIVQVSAAYPPWEPAKSTYWLRTLVEGMPQLVWRSCDMGNWTWSSPQWQVFTGQSQAESKGSGWMEAVHPDDRPAALAAWAGARSHGMLDTEFRVRKAADGSYVWHRTRSLPVVDDNGRIVEWLGTTTDIQDLKLLQEHQASLLADAQRHAHELETEVQDRKRTEERLLYTAFHDDLTKLHNRAYFMGRCRTALTEYHGPQAKATVLLTLDLDRFKLVNDSLGHDSGDLLLRIVAKRLRSCIREQDTVARIGGDEFALLVEDIDHARLAQLAQRILEDLQRPFWFGRRQVLCSCSLGVAWISHQHRRAEEVLRDADLAMYEAKRDGPGQYRVFAEHMRDGALATLDLQTDLIKAVRESQFEVHYQPICDAATAAMIGVEALIRWRHPRRGLLYPDAFIAAAEQRGLIRHIGRFVISEASKQVRLWRDQFPTISLVLHVNLSGTELKDPDLMEHLATTLAAARIEPGSLQLEITESVFLDQPDQVSRILDKLRKFGVRIALDDFGTGYSSLSYLEQYEMDTVKIDRSFVSRMLTHPRTQAVVAAIVQLGQAMRLEIVAEGVESDEQLRALASAGCGSVQGYLLGRPMPVEGPTPVLSRQAGMS